MPRPATVAIVGAGTLGGATAHRLAAKHGVREIRLIDRSKGIADGTALDIRQAGAVEGFYTIVTAHQELHDAIGAGVILLAGPADESRTEWTEEAGLAILERLSVLSPGATVVCLGASHRGLVEHGVTSRLFPRHRLVGSAPLAFASALRAIIGVELRSSPLDVAVTVLGLPPSGIVVCWSTVVVRGTPLVWLLEPPRLGRLQQKVAPLWPPGPYALASAGAYLTRSLLTGATTRACASYVVLDGELGIRGRAMAATVRLDERGIGAIVEPALTPQERAQLDNATAWATRAMAGLRPE